MDYLPNNRIMRCIIYGSGVVVLSEVIWSSYKFLRNFCLNAVNKSETYDVIMFNELSTSCAANHIQAIDSPRKYLTPFSLPKPTTDHCKNPHCAVRNITRIIHFIDSAQYSLDAAIYTFSSHVLYEAFKRALNRGIAIRIISDPEMVFCSGSQINKLKTYNVPVRGPDTTCMMHHKFCIADGDARVQQIMREKKLRNKPRPYKSLILTGSVNWTKQGLGGNWENFVITSNRQIVDKYQCEFDRMWDAFELGKPNKTELNENI